LGGRWKRHGKKQSLLLTGHVDWTQYWEQKKRKKTPGLEGRELGDGGGGKPPRVEKVGEERRGGNMLLGVSHGTSAGARTGH